MAETEPKTTHTPTRKKTPKANGNNKEQKQARKLQYCGK